ncbi:hypothetical protein GCM10027160_25060 [Streptomyces calidiresistens]|uniref:Uncharacterized protein n=1 Tax=Streptomyces calidiresistens TaxID=1485586 RepID=A0A7W3XWT5_9ACTN|nr:hypothetical protein [Streptomyces calidiresistens]MBB0230077.1 hypothetical protein [Streptomyces calidiresistens]
MIERILLLYPRRYRVEYGEEILAVHREATVDAPPLERLRETADITAHAVRMRLGVDSASPTGRFLADAAPFVVAAAAAGSGMHLSEWYASVVASPAPPMLFLDAWSALLFAAAVVVVGAITALTGRWRAGAGAVALGSTGWAVAAAAYGPGMGSPLPAVMALITALLVVAVPPDTRPAPEACAVAGAMAAAVWLPMTALYAEVLPFSTDYGAWPLLAPAITALLWALRTRSRGVREVAVVTVASLPLLAGAYARAWGYPLPIVVITLALPLAGALAAGVYALRPPRRTDRPGPA